MGVEAVGLADDSDKDHDDINYRLPTTDLNAHRLPTQLLDFDSTLYTDELDELELSLPASLCSLRMFSSWPDWADFAAFVHARIRAAYEVNDYMRVVRFHSV